MKLRNLVLVGMLASGIAGCAALQSASTFTATDLNNAIAIDTTGASNPNPTISGPAMEKLACDQWILSQLTLINSQLGSAPVTGFFSGTSAATQAADNIVNALSPAGRAAFETACGPYDLHVAGDAALVLLLKLP